MNKIIVILAILVSFSSCVSTKTPPTEKKAKKKLAKHLTGVKNILNTYPNLSDTMTTIKYDTVVVEDHVVDTVFSPQIDTVYVDSLLDEYTDIVSEKRVLEAQFDRSEREDRRLREVIKRERRIREKLMESAVKDTTFFYEDSVLTSSITIKDGVYVVKYKVKEKKIPTQTEIINNIDTDCYVRKDFYLDWKFYVFLLILVTILWLSRRR